MQMLAEENWGNSQIYWNDMYSKPINELKKKSEQKSGNILRWIKTKL